jgi:hypothetical protein
MNALAAQAPLNPLHAAGRKTPRNASRGFTFCARARRSLSAGSKEEIGQLIERINHLSAHNDERCDHQIKAKMHCQGGAQKFFLQPSRNDAGTGTKLMSYWRGRFAECLF